MSQKELVADPGQESRFPVTHRLPETLSGDPCVNRWGTKLVNSTLWERSPRSQEPMVGGRGASPRSPRRLWPGHCSRFLGHGTSPVSNKAKTKDVPGSWKPNSMTICDQLSRRENLGNPILHALPNKLVHSSVCNLFRCFQTSFMFTQSHLFYRLNISSIFQIGFSALLSKFAMDEE